MPDESNRRQKSIASLANNCLYFTVLGRQILGVQGFWRLGQYFLNLFQESASLLEKNEDCMLVLLTRRCHALFQLYLEYFELIRAFEKSPNENYERYIDPAFLELTIIEDETFQKIKERCITNYNLLSLCPDLAEYYQVHGHFPKIIIADDLLIHGRAFNHLLTDMEGRIVAEFRQSELGDRVLSSLMEAIELHVYAQSNGSLLLLDRYVKRLHSSRKCSRQLWRDLSARFARLTSAASINNISYSLGLRVPFSPKNLKWDLPFDGSYPHFKHYTTGLQEINEDTFLYMYPDDHTVKAICSVRIRKSQLPLLTAKRKEEKNSLVIAPYIAFDHLRLSQVLRLHREIVHDIPDAARELFQRFQGVDVEGVDYPKLKRYYRWYCETNELVLGYLLFRRFADEVYGTTGKTVKSFAQYVDYEMLARNYRRVNLSGLHVSPKAVDVKPLLKALWTWEPPSDTFERYLGILLENGEPLWDTSDGVSIVSGARFNHRILSSDPIAFGVQDAIAEICCETELDAYERTVSSVPFSEYALARWGSSYSIGELLSRCDLALSQLRWPHKPIGQSADIFQVAALLTQAMDLGLIDLSPFSKEDSIETNRQTTICSIARAGEQTLSILPIRYREFIPVLLAIQKKRNNQERVKSEIERFAIAYCEANPEQEADVLAYRLISFLDSLRKTGQTLEEWDIPLMDFSGIDYEYPDGEMIDATDRMIDDLHHRAKNIEIYKQI